MFVFYGTTYRCYIYNFYKIPGMKSYILHEVCPYIFQAALVGDFVPSWYNYVNVVHAYLQDISI